MKFVTIRAIRVFAAIVVCAMSCRFCNAQESPASEKEQAWLSPDKQWEYSDGDASKLVKAGANEIALDLLEQCDLGAVGDCAMLFCLLPV